MAAFKGEVVEEDEDEEFQDVASAGANSGANLKKRKKEKPPVDPDGFRYRKYGKKMIGDEARHYYRCTFAGCEAKRHITYQAAGPSIVMIGNHSHSPPERSNVTKPKKKKIKAVASAVI
jgi:hypothetical protein